MEQMKKYKLVYDNDPNIIIPIRAVDNREAFYKAVITLGWRLISVKEGEEKEE